MDYYSAIKQNEILPFTTTWVDPKGIMLTETSQRKTNTIQFHFKTNEPRKETVVARGEGGRRVGKIGD